MDGRRQRILILEDEPLVAMMLEEMVVELGHEVAGCPQSAAVAREAVETASFDIAIVDVNLWDGAGSALLATILGRNLPVIVSSGYASGTLPDEYEGLPFVGKPFKLDDLARILAPPGTPPVLPPG